MDKLKYNLSRLDQIKLKTYNRWTAAGSPVDETGSPDLSKIQLTSPVRDPARSKESTSFNTSPSSMNNSTASCSSSVILSPTSLKLQKEPRTLLQLLQKQAPPGMKYSLTLVPAEHETSFEEVIRARGRPANGQPPAKRHKMSMNGAVLTDENFRSQIAIRSQENKAKGEKKKKKAEEKENKVVAAKGKGPAKKRSSASASKILKHQLSESEDDDWQLMNVDPNCEENNSQDSNDSDDEECKEQQINLEEENIGQYYAVYWQKPRGYYWGKLLKVFSDDPDDARSGEFNFLQ